MSITLIFLDFYANFVDKTKISRSFQTGFCCGETASVYCNLTEAKSKLMLKCCSRLQQSTLFRHIEQFSFNFNGENGLVYIYLNC